MTIAQPESDAWWTGAATWPAQRTAADGTVRFRTWARPPAQADAPTSWADEVPTFSVAVSAGTGSARARATMAGGLPAHDAKATLTLGPAGGAAAPWSTPVFPRPLRVTRRPAGMLLQWAAPASSPLPVTSLAITGLAKVVILPPGSTRYLVPRRSLTDMVSDVCVVAQVRDPVFGYVPVEPTAAYWARTAEQCFYVPVDYF